MALNDEGGSMYMPVAPAYTSGNGGTAFGSDWGWIILLLLCANGGFGFGGNGFGGGLGYDFPWLLNGQQSISNNVSDGFRDSMLGTQISSIDDKVTSGFGDVQTALCNGFAGVQNGFAQAEISENARQMANMQQMFSLQSALQNCCCENRAATADLKYTVATEACADRSAISSALRDVIEANTASTQRILDTLCQDKIDAKNEKIADLERQLTMANLAASQTAQTSRILADNAAQTVALEQYLNPVPVPAYVVQNPNCCTNTCACGTGCGSF